MTEGPCLSRPARQREEIEKLEAMVDAAKKSSDATSKVAHDERRGRLPACLSASLRLSLYRAERPARE
jgi:hypothetical protein